MEKINPFKSTNNIPNSTIVIKPSNKSISKNKIERLLLSVKDKYDFKMLMQNIHYLRLRKQFPEFNEFCEYVGFYK